MSYAPMDLDKVQKIIPLGKIGVPQHPIPTDHIYFMLKDDSILPGQLPGPNEFYVPADGYIVRIQKFIWTTLETGKSYDDYHFTILHSNSIQTFFGHVYDPSSEILNRAGALIEGENYVFIKVKAGEVIGRGTTPDFAIFDRDKPLPFMNQERYKPTMLYAASPFGYFSESIGVEMLNKTPPAVNVANTGVPRGGRVCYDDIGGIMGNWFLEGSAADLTNIPWSNQLSFARYYDDPLRFEVGISGALWAESELMGNYLVTEGESNGP